MRLVIAGLLTVIIYIMICVFIPETGTKNERKEKQQDHFFEFKVEQLWLPQIVPPYIFRNNQNCTDIQTFPFV